MYARDSGAGVSVLRQLPGILSVTPVVVITRCANVCLECYDLYSRKTCTHLNSCGITDLNFRQQLEIANIVFKYLLVVKQNLLVHALYTLVEQEWHI